MKTKIMVVGDSLSKGVVLDKNNKKYTITKNSFFNLIASRINADMINLSRFGSTVSQGIKVLRSKFEKHDPDIVVIEFGGNDCDFLWDDVAAHPEIDHIPKTPLEDFDQSINSMIDFVLEKGKQPVLATLPPLYADNYFNWFTGSDKEKGKRVLQWLKDIWHIYWWQERYSNCVQHIAQKRNIHCIDVRRKFLQQKDFDEYMCKDGIHPNEAGHRLIFEAVIEHIRENAAYLLPAFA